MGSRGALLFEPYSDDPGNSGLLLIDPKVLEATTTAALAARLAGLHARHRRQGQRPGARRLCRRAAGRPRGTRPPAADRACPGRAQGGRAPVRPAGRDRLDADPRTPATTCAGPTPGSARPGSTEPTPGAGSLDAGVPLAFGSDFPVEIVNPFWGIYAGVTRQDAQGKPPGGWHPEQILTLEETLRGFTAGSAYAAFAEDRLGILKPGFRADLTIVDRDLFQAKPKDLLATQVVDDDRRRNGRP